MKKPSRARSNMPQRIKAYSGSKFVQNQVLNRLPRRIRIEFIPELTDEGEPIMVISSPDYPGILSEARSREEAVENAHDAILTFFDVPRKIAGLIEYVVEEVAEEEEKHPKKERSKPRVETFRLEEVCA